MKVKMDCYKMIESKFDNLTIKSHRVGQLVRGTARIAFTSPDWKVDVYFLETRLETTIGPTGITNNLIVETEDFRRCIRVTSTDDKQEIALIVSLIQSRVKDFMLQDQKPRTRLQLIEN